MLREQREAARQHRAESRRYTDPNAELRAGLAFAIEVVALRAHGVPHLEEAAARLYAEADRLRDSLLCEPREGDREPTDVTPGQVRAWVRQAGYTQAQAADALGVDRGAVSAWVRGVRRPPDWAVRHLRWLARTRGGQG